MVFKKNGNNKIFSYLLLTSRFITAFTNAKAFPQNNSHFLDSIQTINRFNIMLINTRDILINRAQVNSILLTHLAYAKKHHPTPRRPARAKSVRHVAGMRPPLRASRRDRKECVRWRVHALRLRKISLDVNIRDNLLPGSQKILTKTHARIKYAFNGDRCTGAE